MAKIKEIVDNASTIAGSQGGIGSFLYGFREDFNSKRQTAEYPMLMFQKFINSNSIINYTSANIKHQRWSIVLFMTAKYTQGDIYEQIQETMQDEMEEFLETFLLTDNYNIDGDVAISYFYQFDNHNNCGVRYEFTLATQECFGN